MQLPTGQLVQVVYLLLVAPADEVAESRRMGVQRRLCEFALTVFEVQFDGFVESDWFEWHGSVSGQIGVNNDLTLNS